MLYVGFMPPYAQTKAANGPLLSLSWQFTVLQHWTVLTAGILTGTTVPSIQTSLLYCSTFSSLSALPLEASAMACQYFVLILLICGCQSR